MTNDPTWSQANYCKKNYRNRCSMHSWIIIKPGFFTFCVLCEHRLGNTCWVLFRLLPVRRIALTRWLAPKKRIQIKPLESCSTGLSRWQRSKWQALQEKSHPVSIVIFSYIFIYSQIHAEKSWRCSDYISTGVNCVLRCRRLVVNYYYYLYY